MPWPICVTPNPLCLAIRSLSLVLQRMRVKWLLMSGTASDLMLTLRLLGKQTLPRSTGYGLWWKLKACLCIKSTRALPTTGAASPSLMRAKFPSSSSTPTRHSQQLSLSRCFHEYAHLLLRQSAITDHRSRDGNEVYCNKFAAYFLMPAREFRGAALSVGGGFRNYLDRYPTQKDRRRVQDEHECCCAPSREPWACPRWVL